MTQFGKTDPTPLFTVIIPNKNRAKYLQHTLRTCMMQDYERLEVLVSDDGSTENNREVVEDAACRDPRIRFVSHGAGIGMRDNFEYALRQVKPGFVIALGGDDGLLPGGIRGMHEVLRETGTEMLSWPAPRFSYPGVLGPHGQLAIFRERGTRVIDSQTFLRRQVTQLHYLSDVESPMFYVKGVVSTRLVDRVRDRSPEGRFYSCPTPDGYSGIVLAGETPCFAFSGKPFAMHGLSPDSQGLAHISNGEKAKESTQKFLQSVSSRPMHEELASQPYSPLITLMTADYLLTVRDLPGWGGSLPPIDYRSLLRKALSELAHGLYGDERVCRELGILNQIAQRHGLTEFFQDLVRGSSRMRKRAPFEGSGINAVAWFHDARTYELGDIVDAAYAAKYLYQAYLDATPSALFRVVGRSLLYRLRAMRRGGPFPSVSQWGAQQDVPVGAVSVVG
jgi:hypothetical protein